MRGEDIFQASLFTTVQLETFVPDDHPLRSVRTLLDETMQRLGWLFDSIYATAGRESIPPERFIRAQLLQVLYSIRIDRQLVEQINYNLLYRWFVELIIVDSVRDHSSFTASRDRLLQHDVITELFEEVDNLARKGAGKEAKLSYMGHTVMENRNGLIDKAAASQATGKAEPKDVTALLAQLPGSGKKTLGDDKNYDTAQFVSGYRVMKITPHVARNDKRPGRSAMDSHTSRYLGYKISQRSRKRVEEPFGWGKTAGFTYESKAITVTNLQRLFVLDIVDRKTNVLL